MRSSLTQVKLMRTQEASERERLVVTTAQAGQREPAGATRGERTRAAVLGAARERFALEGFDGTTVARIASDAGVSEPTVAFHFGSKAGLLVAVIEAYYDELLDALDEAIDSTLPPEQRLRAFARWWLAHNARNLRLLSVFGRQGRRPETDEVTSAFRAANRRVTRVFDRLVDDLRHVGTLRSEVSTRIVRDAFFGATEHLMLGRALSGRSGDLDDAADELVDLLLHGATVPCHGDPADGPVDRAVEGPYATRSQVAALDAKLDRVLDRLR